MRLPDWVEFRASRTDQSRIADWGRRVCCEFRRGGMNTVLIIAGVAIAGYFILGTVMQGQQQAAITACGGPLSFQATTCPQFQVVTKDWAWYPQWNISL
jgi:hypothetical protein